MINATAEANCRGSSAGPSAPSASRTVVRPNPPNVDTTIEITRSTRNANPRGSRPAGGSGSGSSGAGADGGFSWAGRIVRSGIRSAARAAPSGAEAVGAGAGAGDAATVTVSAAAPGDSRTGWLSSDAVTCAGGTGVVGAGVVVGTADGATAVSPAPGSVPQCKQAKPAGRSALQLAQVWGSSASPVPCRTS